MNKGKRSIVLYIDLLQHVRQLPLEEAGAVFLAVLNYADTGELPELTGAVGMCFSFIRAQLDRDTEKWEETRAKRIESGRIGGIASGIVRNQAEANETSASKSKLTEANEAVNVTVPVNVPVYENYTLPDNKNENEEYYDLGPYGHVKLTAAEYTKLVRDLGQEETDRVIACVDEKAQMTNNKNGWKDWNTVLRKASREKWGIDNPNQ